MHTLSRIVSVCLIACLVADPALGGCLAPSGRAERVNSVANPTVFSDQALTLAVITSLQPEFRYLPHKVQSFLYSQFPYWRNLREPASPASAFATHEIDPAYIAQLVAEARRAVRAQPDRAERRRWNRLIILATQAFHAREGEASLAWLTPDGRFIPSRAMLRNVALLIWMRSATGSLSEAWASRQSEFRTICRVLIEDSLLHEAVHRELGQNFDARDTHAIAQYVDDLGRDHPYRDLPAEKSVHAQQLFERLPIGHPVRRLAEARLAGRIEHGFAGFDEAAINALVEQIVTLTDAEIVTAAALQSVPIGSRMSEHGPLQAVQEDQLPLFVREHLVDLEAFLHEPLPTDTPTDVSILPSANGKRAMSLRAISIERSRPFYFVIPDVSQDLLRFRKIPGSALGRSEMAMLVLALTPEGRPDIAAPPQAWGWVYEREGEFWFLVGDRQRTLYESRLPSPRATRRGVGLITAPAFEHLILEGLHFDSESNRRRTAARLLQQRLQRHSLSNAESPEGMLHQMAHSTFVLPLEHSRLEGTRLIVLYALPFVNRLALIIPEQARELSDLVTQPWVLLYENIIDRRLEFIDPQGRLDSIALTGSRPIDRREGDRYDRYIRVRHSANIRHLLDQLTKFWTASTPAARNLLQITVGNRIALALNVEEWREPLAILRQQVASPLEGPQSNQALIMDAKSSPGSILDQTLAQLGLSAAGAEDAGLTFAEALLRKKGAPLTPALRAALERTAMVRFRVPYAHDDEIEIVTEGMEEPVIQCKTFQPARPGKGVVASFNLNQILWLLAHRRPSVVSDRLVSFLKEPSWTRVRRFYRVVRWKDPKRPWWFILDNMQEVRALEAARASDPEFDQAIEVVEYTGDWMEKFVPEEERTSPKSRRRTLRNAAGFVPPVKTGLSVVLSVVVWGSLLALRHTAGVRELSLFGDEWILGGSILGLIYKFLRNRYIKAIENSPAEAFRLVLRAA